MRKLIAAATAVVATLGAGVITASASPENPSRHIVEVTKIVEGDPGTENTYVVEIDCGDTGEFNAVFDEEGGTQAVEVGTWLSGPQECTIEEVVTGGATTVEITETVCEFPGKVEETLAAEVIYPDVICETTVTNEFEPVTTTTVPVPPVIIEQPVVVPTPVVVAPQFTG